MMIEILNWAKYNPRSDVKATTWMRVNNDYLTRMFKFSNEEKLVWIGLLSEASVTRGGAITPDLDLLAFLIRRDVETVKAAIKTFEAAEMIAVKNSRTLRPRDADDTQTLRPRDADDTLRTDVRTNERTPGGKAPPTPFDTQLAEEWIVYAKAHSTTVRPNREEWAITVRQLRELDKFSEADIRAMLNVARTDPFWQPVAVSLPGLRTRNKSTGKLKAENLLNATKRNQQSPKLTQRHPIHRVDREEDLTND